MAPPFQRISLWTLAFCCALRLLTMCVCGRGVGGVFLIMARVECFHTGITTDSPYEFPEFGKQTARPLTESIGRSAMK